MFRTTICLLRKDGQILLAMKKRGHGVGKWNGIGGKAQESETIEQAAIRETQEEIGVTPLKVTKVAEITFLLPPEKNYDQFCTVFWCDSWRGDPQESEEMRPEWFALGSIPYDDMWESDRHWLPEVIVGKRLAAIVDATKDGAMNYSAQYVDNFA